VIGQYDEGIVNIDEIAQDVVKGE
jgi:hypothetical protein